MQPELKSADVADVADFFFFDPRILGVANIGIQSA
jgi:hypothetical protein